MFDNISYTDDDVKLFVGIGTCLAPPMAGLGTRWAPAAILQIPSLKAATGTSPDGTVGARYLCIDTAGNVSSSASACSGT